MDPGCYPAFLLENRRRPWVVAITRDLFSSTIGIYEPLPWRPCFQKLASKEADPEGVSFLYDDSLEAAWLAGFDLFATSPSQESSAQISLTG